MTDLPTLPRADGLTRWTKKRDNLGGISILDRLFNRMDGAYGTKWKANFPSPQAIENWRDECATAFDEEGITPAQVIAGIRACRRLHTEWPPNVQQFVNACLSPLDPVAAYHEALAGLEARGKGEPGTWSHPAVYWAATKLRGDLMHQAYGQMKDRWAAVLKLTLAKGAWESIPEPRVLLAPAEPTRLTKEEAAARLAKLGAASIIKRPGDGSDHKRWARALLEQEADEKLPLERRAKPDRPPLTLAQIKAARAALGMQDELRPLADEIKRNED